MPQAPNSASLSEYSQGSRTGRVAEPKGSAAGQPTVHRPNENLSSSAGLRMGRLLINWLSKTTYVFEHELRRSDHEQIGPELRRTDSHVIAWCGQGRTGQARGQPCRVHTLQRGQKPSQNDHFWVEDVDDATQGNG